MIRHGLKPIIVILNNNGYVVERLIHGKDRKYNDIQPWRWQQLLDLFSPEPGTSQSYCTRNRAELEALLANEEFQRADKIQCVSPPQQFLMLTFAICRLVECMLGDFDAPRALRAQADMVTKTNKAIDSD